MSRDSESEVGDRRQVRSFEALRVDAGADFAWTTRARGTGGVEAAVSARSQTFRLCGQASFREADPAPSAIEYLLGALGGDLVSGFATHAARRGIEVFELEAAISGQLNNPLFFLGVIGQEGHPGIDAVWGALYVSADAGEEMLQEIWEETLLRSPLVNTLRRGARLSLELRIVP